MALEEKIVFPISATARAFLPTCITAGAKTFQKQLKKTSYER
jgi:hypothetical protein